MDGGGGEAEAGEHPPPVYSGGLRGEGWVGGVSLPHLVEGFCAQNGVAREVRLELAFSRYEVYEDKIREVYRPKGLLAFTAAAGEYVRLL
jgi:hypothetical protein